MRILLLTDVPPTRKLTAGLVLDRLCRFLPPGAVACFAVVNPSIDTELTDDLRGVIPIHYVDKPKEDGLNQFARWPWLKPVAQWLRGLHDRHVAVPRLVEKAAQFGRTHKVDAVWVTLQGQTMIHMAKPLAERLGVPLFTLVWDPLSWWLKSNAAEPATARAAQKAFDEAILASRAVATASWAMTEEYNRRYRGFSVPVIASLDASVARSPPPRPHREGELVIGMAGQFYALNEWEQVVSAFNACNWRIAGRDVKLRLAGHYAPPSNIPPGKLETLGWLSQPDLVQHLSECDLLYCPYPFDPAMDEVSRLSFPSKLVAYLAAGRPVIFHGPKSASPARYVVQHGAGLITENVFASSVYNVVERLAKDSELYARCAENATRAFMQDFTFERMRECFFEFLRIEEGDYQGKTFAPAAPIDQRNPKLRTARQQVAPTEGIVMRTLSVLPQVRHYKRQVAELAQWKAVHVKELDGLYRHVRYLTGEIENVRDSRADEIIALRNQVKEMHAEIRGAMDSVAMRDTALRAILAELGESDEVARQMARRLEMSQLSAQRAEALRREMAEAIEKVQSTAQHEREQFREEREALLTAARDHAASEQAVLADTMANAAREREALLADARAAQSAIGDLSEKLRIAQREIASRLTEIGERDKILSKLGKERDDALTKLYEDGVVINRRSAAFEVEVGQLKQANELLLARILGKISKIEYDRRAEISLSRNDASHSDGSAYLDLLEDVMVGSMWRDPGHLGSQFDPEIRAIGRDKPQLAYTMIGSVRMRNVRMLVEDILRSDVPGDFIETGVWRGGACIYMRAILRTRGASNRKVFVADSFMGLPKPNPEEYPADSGDIHHTYEEMSISLDAVKGNFERFGLLDEQVVFLPGWFKDTLPAAPIEKLALLRLDGDMYESTMQALEALFDKVSPGGFIVVDDFDLPNCRKAIADFRAQRGINDTIHDIDGAGVYWRKTAVVQRPHLVSIGTTA